MLFRYAIPIFAFLSAAPQLALAEPLQIAATQIVAPPRKDIGDGLCVTVVHAADPALGQVAFNSVDDAVALLNRAQTPLTEDGRISARYSLIDFRNNDPVSVGDFTGGDLFPYSDNPGAVPQGNDRNFAVRVRGYINVDPPESIGLRRTIGLYADDGARLSIGGQPVTTPDLNQRISNRRIRNVQYAANGMYPIELLYYQDGSLAVLELSESNVWVPETTKLTDLSSLDFYPIGEPRKNRFVNTELYTARVGSVTQCVECNDDATCGKANYCAKDWGTIAPAGLCQPCNFATHCGPSCLACGSDAPICDGSSCIQCRTDSDCKSGNLCDLTSHRCEPVVQNWDYVGGCSVASPAPRSSAGLILGGAAALLLLMLLLRKKKLPVAQKAALLFLVLAAEALAPATAHAQLSVNGATLQPAIGPENIITVEGSRTVQRWRPMAVVLLDYAHRPLRLIDRDSEQTIANTIPDMVALHLMGGMGLTRWLSLAFDLPVVAYQSFDRTTPIADVPTVPSSYGLGDIRLVAKARIVNNTAGGFGLAFVPQVTFATGDGTQFRGANAYGIEPRVALDYRTPGGAIIALNVGFLGRTSNQVVGRMEVGSQVRYGLGMFVPLAEGFGLLGEVAGGTSVNNIKSGNIYSPLEGLVGGRWVHSTGINVNLGAGMGFTDAVGSPQVRMFASIGYAPMERHTTPTTPPPPPPSGSPTPGIVLVEKSGSGAGAVTSYPRGIDCGQLCSGEFKLGSQVTLKAQPGFASRFVGWSGPCSGTEDCVLTVTPNTRLGVEFATVEEKRGTLTVDKEGDGTGEVISEPTGISCGTICSSSFKENQQVRLFAIADKESRFAGWEGACSGLDPCTITVRGEPRLKARFIKAKIKVETGKLDLQGNVIHFETAKANIDIDSFHLLDEVVLIMRQFPEMRLRIEGHTDAVPFNAPGGNIQLSKDRAAAVVNYLIRHSIQGGRLSNEGFGDTCPVATNKSPTGRQSNRRTEFLIIDKQGKYQRTPCVSYTSASNAQAPRQAKQITK